MHSHRLVMWPAKIGLHKHLHTGLVSHSQTPTGTHAVLRQDPLRAACMAASAQGHSARPCSATGTQVTAPAVQSTRWLATYWCADSGGSACPQAVQLCSQQTLHTSTLYWGCSGQSDQAALSQTHSQASRRGTCAPNKHGIRKQPDTGTVQTVTSTHNPCHTWQAYSRWWRSTWLLPLPSPMTQGKQHCAAAVRATSHVGCAAQQPN